METAWQILNKHGFVIGPRFKDGWYRIDKEAPRTGWLVYKDWLHADTDLYDEIQKPLAEADTLAEAIFLAEEKLRGNPSKEGGMPQSRQ